MYQQFSRANQGKISGILRTCATGLRCERSLAGARVRAGRGSWGAPAGREGASCRRFAAESSVSEKHSCNEDVTDIEKSNLEGKKCWLCEKANNLVVK